MPVPSGVKVEIEWTAGTFTDVTADYDHTVGYQIHIGRTSAQGGQPQPSTLSLSLWNTKGKYTPGAAVLTDGTAAPYWPNVGTDKRIRVSDSAGVQFVGEISALTPGLDNGALSRMNVTAIDRMDRLSRVEMQAPIAQEVVYLDSGMSNRALTLYWPLTDPAGSTSATEWFARSPLVPAKFGGGTYTFGSAGPITGDGTSLTFTPVSDTVGQLLGINPLPVAQQGSRQTLAFAFNAGSVAPASVDRYLASDQGSSVQLLHGSGDIWFQLITGPAVCDGNWHTCVAVQNQGTGVASLYVDGVLAGTAAAGNAWTQASGLFSIGGDYLNSQFCSVVIAHVGLFSDALSAGQAAAFDSAVRGWYGETTATRIARFLGYAGLTASDYSLDTSPVTVNTYSQAGTSVLTGCQDMAATEGQGSVVYVKGGTVVFRNRAFRKPGSPALTVDMVNNGDRDVFAPSLDRSTLINSQEVDRVSESGTQQAFIATNAASITARGTFSGSTVNSNATDTSDPLYLAQSIVAANGTPGLRLPQVSVDLLSGSTSLYAAVQALEIGSRVRLTSVPQAVSPASQIDGLVEGWTRTVSINTNKVLLDLSPADVPAWGVFDDTTYGLFAPDAGSMTLNSSLTSAATTVVIATSGGKPTFTTASVYPITITIDAEDITLNSPPGGSSSPQTFTGVTRGAQGTYKAAHANGAGVDLALIPAFVL